MTTEARRRLFLLAASTGLSLLAAEFALRATFSWLFPVAAANSRFVGVPAAQLRARLLAARAPETKVVFIGDSFTESGEVESILGVGWGRILGQEFRSQVALIGFSATGPAQYLRVLDELRDGGYQGRAVLVLFLGNDFSEQALWDQLGLADLGADASIWPLYRQGVRPLPSGVPMVASPCWVAGPTGVVRRDVKGPTPEFLRQTALYRAYQIARTKGLSWLGGSDAPRAQLLEFLRKSCSGPGVREVGGRLFFEERPSESEANEQDGLSSVIRLLRARRADPKLSLVLIRPREDVCRSVHGMPARSYDGEVKKISELGIAVLDPSPAFSAACRQTDLYLPDGHWNAEGHATFARALRPLMAGGR